jgi:hypothetical protein
MKKGIALLLLMLLPLSANAEWPVGGGYYNVSDDEGGVDISVGAITGSVAYRFETESDFSVIPELRLGFGVGDDTVLGVDVEIDRIVAFSVRGQFDFPSGAYVFAAPAYADIEVEASSGGASASESDSEFGFGGGVGFRFTDSAMAEVSYAEKAEKVSDTFFRNNAPAPTRPTGHHSSKSGLYFHCKG